ncbi:MAG: hypothetical protein CM1200mP15_06920 [Dehalococcoidia bacterium]|nr:MAG: hypothetical protein CM1200mP15_06920 [Dehalococcoidia bacterium]
MESIGRIKICRIRKTIRARQQRSDNIYQIDGTGVADVAAAKLAYDTAKR